MTWCPDETYLKNTADTKTSSAAPLCHTAVLSAFRAKEYILVLADGLQSCLTQNALKNPRVTLISTWCSRCHCPLCLPRTLHCQTSPRWSGSGTWNIQFYHLKILTKIWVALSAITWGPPALALQGSERQGSKAGESLRPPNQLLPSCWRKSNHIFITATNPDQWSVTTSSYVSILCWELHIHI